MKNMKSILSFLVCLVLIFSLVGCGAKDEPAVDSTIDESSEPIATELDNSNDEPLLEDSTTIIKKLEAIHEHISVVVEADFVDSAELIVDILEEKDNSISLDIRLTDNMIANDTYHFAITGIEDLTENAEVYILRANEEPLLVESEVIDGVLHYDYVDAHAMIVIKNGDADVDTSTIEDAQVIVNEREESRHEDSQNTEETTSVVKTYGEPEWIWDGFSSASAKFTSTDGTSIKTIDATITSQTTKEPTTTEDGTVEYTATVVFSGKPYVDVKIETLEKLTEQHVHRYGAPTWQWNGYSAVTATFTCIVDDDVQVLTADVKAITKEPQIGVKGSTTYTATVVFDGTTYTDKKVVEIAALEEPVKEHTHSYDAPTWNWSGYESATATFRCVENDDSQTIRASVKSTVTKEPTEKTEGLRTHTATVSFGGQTYTNTKTETIPKKVHTHSYGNPAWSWNGYDSAVATFKCTANDDAKTVNAAIDSAITKEPTTTSTGTRTYTAKVIFEGKTYTDTKTETLDKLPEAHKHSYDEPSWTWNGFSSADAYFTCTANDDVQRMTATITSKVTKEPTTTSTGTKVYTATVMFNGKQYTDSKTETLAKLPSHTHSYGTPTWNWNGYTSATAIFKCTAGDDTRTLGATITSKITQEPTTSREGIRTYTATVTFDGKQYTNTKTESIPKLHSHSYGNPTWNWNGYASATATFTCSAGDDTQTINATITNRVVTTPTENATGVREYTASVTFGGKTYTNTKNETLDKLPHNHSYGNPTWSWSGYTSATATFKCTSGDDIKTVNASISSRVTKEPTETTTGTKEYTASVTFNDKTYTDTKTETLPKQTHTHSWDSGKVTKEPTCAAEGIKTYTCTKCGETRTESIAKTNNHVHTEIRNKKDATCTTAGYSGDTYCKDCGTKLSSGSTVAALGHREITKNAKSATCSSEGYTGDTVCSVCGVTIQQGTTIPKTEHSWDRGRTEKVATCTETGVKSYTCTVCDATKTETIPINPNNHNHVWDHDEEEPVYESCGVTEWWVEYWPYPKTDPRSFDNSLIVRKSWTARNAFEDEVASAKASYSDFINNVIPSNNWKEAGHGFGETGETVSYIAYYRTIHYYKCTRCGDMITK